MEYCDDYACPSAAESPYLTTLGKLLDERATVLWTGDGVISERITPSSLRGVRRALPRHRLILWDNLFANDYDKRRAFTGPYQGRDATLVEDGCGVLSGVLLNPNCQAALNFMPIHTFRTWIEQSHWPSAC